MARERSRAQRDGTIGGLILGIGAVVTFVAWAVGARLGAALTAGVVTCIVLVLVAMGVDAKNRASGAKPKPTGRRPGDPPAPQVPTSARAKPRRKR